MKYHDVKTVFKKYDNGRFFSNKLFSKFQCGISALLDNYDRKKQRSVDKGGQVGVFLTSFSKAFDCIDYDH